MFLIKLVIVILVFFSFDVVFLSVGFWFGFCLVFLLLWDVLINMLSGMEIG